MSLLSKSSSFMPAVSNDTMGATPEPSLQTHHNKNLLNRRLPKTTSVDHYQKKQSLTHSQFFLVLLDTDEHL